MMTSSSLFFFFTSNHQLFSSALEVSGRRRKEKSVCKRVENKVCMQGRMEAAEGEKSVDKYDSEDDKRLIESLELHIGSLTPNGKGETAAAVTRGEAPAWTHQKN